MSIPYDLKHPERRYRLPKRYAEISGIWHLPGRDSLAFVHDEALAVHELHLADGSITAYPSHAPRDAEDIVILGQAAYVLVAGKRPTMSRIEPYGDPDAEIRHFDLELDMAHDPEGLGYDSDSGRLLIACKGSPIPGDRTRAVYAFDPATGQRGIEPRLVIDSRDFLDNDKETFHPAGIAVHPDSGEVYLVGTRSVKILLRYDRRGNLQASQRLDKKRFRQPEGIAFSAEGELFICSEGRDGKKARVYRFRRQD